MSLPGKGRFVLLLMPIIAGLHAAFYYNALPERMASHFNSAGVADGAMGKDAFIAFYVGLVSFMVAVFSGTSVIIRSLPTGQINLPNRDYWLAPERRDATIRIIGDDLAGFGALTCCLIIALMEFTFRTNLTANPHLGQPPMFLIVGFLIAEFMWLMRMVLRFSQMPAVGASSR